MSDIRYYRRDHKRYYVISDVDAVLISDEGGFCPGWGRLPHVIAWPEIFAKPGLSPDPDPIEERYINATDRPSVEGFKHPDVVEPW